MKFNSVLSVDPGGTTGFNTWTAREPARPGVGWQMPYEDFARWVGPYVRSAEPGSMVIVCEDFTINPDTHKKAGSRWSLEQIGILRALAWDGQHRFELQMVGDAKQFATNAVLQQIDWYRKGHVHANDATRHMLLFFARIGWFDGRVFTPRVTAAN